MADGHEPTEQNLARVFRLHVHRGISYLVGSPALTSVAGLLETGVIRL